MIAVIEKELGTSAVEGSSRFDAPRDFELRAGYPNPLHLAQNRELTIAYQLNKASGVVLQVYDLMGRQICTLARGRQSAGTHTLTWNGRDGQNQIVPSGAYFVQLRVGNLQQTKKITLIQ
ncbi:MAG: T9SS type A sorting domain-containing protein [candidate division KSB1 bacterium]|nr:T9SS type A sorting domain-containing protein [candidate division KSB1 bacterium]MDZ7369030.1 T9SS type A sorting domain-containing protein [candidate division KSB1 bacterium]MDZ7407046.1 T9SS type A sorting domain-containing protein [candidate division KSB1 bacterium]